MVNTSTGYEKKTIYTGDEGGVQTIYLADYICKKIKIKSMNILCHVLDGENVYGVLKAANYLPIYLS